MNDMHEKLQAEKTRLALAIQACESATSMSRPGSPRDVHAPAVPTKELECRARLGDAIDQDIADSSESDSPSEISLLFEHLEEPGSITKLNPLIDKVQTYLGQLTSTISELQEREKQKEDLKRWIETQRTVINDWKNKPTKLRPDGIKQDLATMNELLLSFGQRKQQLLTDFHSSDVSELENLLDALEVELCELIAQRQMHQELIEDYRQNLQGVNNWFDSLSKQIEAIDKGFWLHCQQKQSTLLEIKADFDENSPNKMDKVKTLAATIISIVNNLDSQLIEEQMKSLEKKYAEIQRRIHRKLEVIEIMQKVLDEMKSEINNAREWVKINLADLRKQEPIGFEVYKADDRLNALKSLLKETHNKTVLRDTILKRVNNMVNELEPSEKSHLENDLKI
ncbi:hypothetical protein WA026_011943 [Henosepilachna vigintioctopunctata]|uniref:Uncharacterized protein n=1 Tax=Henosepilachna vigintioctopunctata TaxID=420089 RepID=A0AAW1V671_9CUCU